MWASIGLYLAASFAAARGGAFAALAIGPALGCAAMARLARSPMAARVAGGRG